jgi:hypothetical protein
MEIDQTAKAILAELDRCDGHLTVNEAPPVTTVNLYDGDAAVRGFGQPVQMGTLIYLRDRKLITRVDRPDELRGPGQKRYKINGDGRAALR